MNITKIRSFLYTTAKILGDIQAVRKGKVKQRIARRVTGKVIGRTVFNKALPKAFKILNW